VEPTGTDKREDRHQRRRLDQRQDRHLSARAHPAERRSGVQPGERDDHGAVRQQRDHHEQIGHRRQRRRHRDERRDDRNHQRHRHRQHRGDPEHLARTARVDRLLAQLLAQVPPRLPDTRPGPAFEARPDLPHQPQQQRRPTDDHDGLQQPAGHAEAGHRVTTSRTSRPQSVAKP
jgi:hypothetical protein